MRLVVMSLVLFASLGVGTAQTVATFPVPSRTGWKPVGCRPRDARSGALASRGAWRSLHSDEVNTDEVSVAYAPMFQADWVAEPNTWNPTGPVFDDAGNLYFAPSNPAESVVLISLDPLTGARRWAIPNTTGAPAGAGTPLVLDDPDRAGEQIVYLGLYDHILAVRTNGDVVWDQPTGLTGTPTIVFGVNYHAGADALFGLTRDGYLYAVDRRTGVSILPAPYQLPGDATPPTPPSTVPQFVLDCTENLLHGLTTLGGRSIAEVIGILLGNGVEVANYFSIDPASGRLWVGATAPDAEDGVADGVSQLGALYRLDLTGGPGGYIIAPACHASFEGGSASTVAMPRDGSRAYVGDNVGNLLAIDGECQPIWSIPVGGQIIGSVGVASDNNEVYASTASTIHQVIDHGTSASIQWSAPVGTAFHPLPGQISGNTDLAGIGANGIAFQAGVGYQFTNTVFVDTGMGLLDRLTGDIRWFAEGLEETVAVMSTGPDGSLYIGNSPLRRAFGVCLAQAGIVNVPVAPIVGGIRKYAPIRNDVFFRDVVCAAADRARNAKRIRKTCPDSYAADQAQLDVLLGQARRTLDRAVATGDLSASVATRLDTRLARAELRRNQGGNPSGAFRPICRVVERALR